MSEEVSMISSLRKAMESVGQGMGIAEAVARSLRTSGKKGREVSRRILLGFAIDSAVRPLLSSDSEEVAMLAALLGVSSKSSASLLGTAGERLSHTLEDWVKLRESRKMEERVQRFRCLLGSCVVGAVSAMVASLGPMLGSLYTLTVSQSQGPNLTLYAGAAMAAISSGMLALYVSERRIYVNVALSLASFCLVSFLVSPLTNFTFAPLLAAK